VQPLGFCLSPAAKGSMQIMHARSGWLPVGV
jgi:hypothetical protein